MRYFRTNLDLGIDQKCDLGILQIWLALTMVLVGMLAFVPDSGEAIFKKFKKGGRSRGYGHGGGGYKHGGGGYGHGGGGYGHGGYGGGGYGKGWGGYGK